MYTKGDLEQALVLEPGKIFAEKHHGPGRTTQPQLDALLHLLHEQKNVLIAAEPSEYAKVVAEQVTDWYNQLRPDCTLHLEVIYASGWIGRAMRLSLNDTLPKVFFDHTAERRSTS